MSYTPDQLVRIATEYVKLAQKVVLLQPEKKPHKANETLFGNEIQEFYDQLPQVTEHEGIENVEELPEIALEDITDADDLEATAAKKEKKKLDPKAKVRNRGTVCVPAESAKDKKDHFPINDEGQARNALARVHQYSSAPSWYKGSLTSLQNLVSRKVHSKYPGIGKSEKKSKKSSLDISQDLLRKYGS